MKLISKFPNVRIEENEKENFENFLELKGVKSYKKIEKLLEGKVQEITYSQLSHYYRYDIKLRRVLYICFSLLELAMRSEISNNYEIEGLTEQNFEKKINNCFNKKIKLSRLEKKKNRIILDKEPKTLFDYLENCDMSQLVRIIQCLPEDKLKNLFPNLNDMEKLNKNLNAAIFLRNKVFHHRLLLDEKLKEVYLKGKECEGLKDNIINIIDLIPKRARGNISQRINSCLIIDEESKDCSQSNKYNLLDEHKIELQIVEDIK